MARARLLCALILVALWLGTARGAHADQRPSVPPSRQEVDQAVRKATAFLLDQLDGNGICKKEFKPGNVRYPGRTALCAYALAGAGVKPRNEPKLEKALEWLVRQEPNGVYPVAMRTCALAASVERKRLRQFRKFIARDAKWLVAAAGDKGQYTYGPLNGSESDFYDNSNAQIAAMALGAAADVVDVPLKHWQRVRQWWQAQQQPDGGWAYRVPRGTFRVKSYGSMTAAGLATLLICSEHLSSREVVRCAASPADKSIDEAMGWLEKNYTVRENPGKGVQWQYYWLLGLQRVGKASGRRYLGGKDWYADGAKLLLSRQRSDGSWGLGDRIAETAFALLFLSRGRQPVIVNKLQYPGRWNTRPRDASNFARWMSHAFETPTNWHVVDANSPLEHLQEAPLLYVSGAGPIQLTDAQLARLRRYVLRGGMIVSEAACGNGDFTLDMQRIYEKILPEWKLTTVAEDSALRSVQYELDKPPVLAISNGVRTLAVHAPRELSLALHFYREEDDREIFETLANAYMAATDSEIRLPGDVPAWPADPNGKPGKTLTVARVKHEANWNPEPLAFDRLAGILRRDHGVGLKVTGGVPIEKLDPGKHPLAVMTGTRSLKLSAGQSRALKAYLQKGGTLIVDAAGGSKPFATSVEEQILTLPDAAAQTRLLLSDKVFSRGLMPMKSVTYRRDVALRMSERTRNLPRVVGVASGGRMVIFYSAEDLTAGLVGYRHAGIRGYAPKSATAIMANLLHYASNQEIADSSLLGGE